MTAKTPYQAVLFDLDGTLTDSIDGIVRCIDYALVQLAIAVPDMTTLRTWIGPPLHETFKTYLRDPQLSEQAILLYRERFDATGMYENRLYPGIPELLDALRARGCRLFLATGKPVPAARAVLEHFDILPYFAQVGGSSLDGTITNKYEVIGSVLPHLSPAERAACVMVGDRETDIRAAHEHGLPAIAAGYGYGSPEELATCGPQCIVASVAELQAVLCGSAAASGERYG